MEIIITVIIAAIVGAIVYFIMSLLDFLRPYAQIGGVVAFLIVVLVRLTGGDL